MKDCNLKSAGGFRWTVSDSSLYPQFYLYIYLFFVFVDLISSFHLSHNESRRRARRLTLFCTEMHQPHSTCFHWFTSGFINSPSYLKQLFLTFWRLYSLSNPLKKSLLLSESQNLLLFSFGSVLTQTVQLQHVVSVCHAGTERVLSEIGWGALPIMPPSFVSILGGELNRQTMSVHHQTNNPTFSQKRALLILVRDVKGHFHSKKMVVITHTKGVSTQMRVYVDTACHMNTGVVISFIHTEHQCLLFTWTDWLSRRVVWCSD